MGILWDRAGQFDVPFDIDVDVDGSVYVSEYHNKRVQVFASDGTYQRQWSLPGWVTGLDVAGGKVYVAVQERQRIQVHATTGAYLTEWGVAGTGNGQFDQPGDVHVGLGGAIYVADFSSPPVPRSPAKQEAPASLSS